MSTNCAACKFEKIADEPGSKVRQNNSGAQICERCWLKNKQILSGIKTRYLGARISDFAEGAREKFEWMAHQSSGYIWGNVGVGKTHALCSVATARIIAIEKRVVVVPWGDLVRKWRSCFSKKGEMGEEEFFDLYSSCENLFIDDIGDEMGEESHGVKAMFCDLVDRRYSDESYTIMSSNLSPSALAETFAKKVSDRIVESCKVIQLCGKNRREAVS